MDFIPTTRLTDELLTGQGIAQRFPNGYKPETDGKVFKLPILGACAIII